MALSVPYTATTGIVHLGVGNFHRAHQAVFTDAVLRTGDTQWGICGVSLRSDLDSELFSALDAQGRCYSVLERGASEQLRTVGCHTQLLLADVDSQRETVVAALADAAVRVITLTVTEKGYCLGTDGEPDWALPGLSADLAVLQRGEAGVQTAPGLLVAGLAARRKAGAGPVAVLSCDNLAENGARTKKVVMALAQTADADLAAWIAAEVAFPSSMVDRITPRTSPEVRARVAELGVPGDACPIGCEEYLLWVIEDNFPRGRPAWETVAPSLGGQCWVVPDVVPYELMKLRVLNGAHQAVCYPSILLGYTYVHEALLDERVARFLRAYMAAAATTVPPVEGVDVAEWAAATFARFENPAIADTHFRLAEDATNRLEVAVVPLGAMPAVTSVLACWIKYCTQEQDAKGVAIKRAPDARQPAQDAGVAARLAALGCAPGLAEEVAALAEQSVEELLARV